jgi:hypothetical protein
MKPLTKLCIVIGCLLIVSIPSQAQILKKLKDKVNKAVDKAVGPENQAEGTDTEQSANNSTSTTTSERKADKSVKWCDTITAIGNGAGKDGVEYALAYTGQGGAVNILYDESTLGLNNDPKGHRIIFTERVNNKTQYVVVENGKVVSTGPEVDPKYLPKKLVQNTVNDGSIDSDDRMKKYVLGDTVKTNIPKSDAKSATIQKIDDDQFEMAMEMAKQTDDYKNMSDAEKKEFEETMRQGMAKNNQMAGTKVDIPAQAGGTIASVNGYWVVVKGKKYGKFLMPPALDVSADETKFFAVGIDEKGDPAMIVNGKKTALDPDKYAATTGRILRSPDQKRFVYIEQKKMSDKELDDLSKAAATGRNMKLTYNVLRSDGSAATVTDHNSSGKFRLTNSGSIVTIDENTGEVFADNKSLGKFKVKDGDRLSAEGILIGNDISQIAYYDGAEGSLVYLDGTVRKMDIMYPRVKSENGKSELSWFRRCGNKIYIAKFAY